MFSKLRPTPLRRAIPFAAVLVSYALATPFIRPQDAGADVQQLYTEAQAAQSSGDTALAEARYKRILELQPTLAPAYNNLGRIYFNANRYSEAVSTLSEGLRLNPDMAPAQVMLGASLLHLGRAADAVQPLQTGVAALPDDRFARLQLVRALSAAGRPDDALSQLNTSLHNDPKDQEAWYLAGKLHLQLSQADFARVQSIDPHSVLAEVMSGEIMESMQNTPGAVLAYKQAIAAEGDDGTDGLQHLAYLYWSTGDWRNADAAYTALLKRDPGDCTARWRGAEARMELGQTSPDVLTDFNQAIAACPGLAQAHADRARLLLRSGDAAAALKDLKTAEAAAPDEPSVQQLLAQTYHALGNKAAADEANRRFADLDARIRQAKEIRASSVVKANE